jgi:hypothetical protein
VLECWSAGVGSVSLIRDRNRTLATTDCFVRNYEFGIVLDSSGGEGNSYIDNSFTLVNSPIFLGNTTSSNPVVIRIPVVITN